MLNIGINGYRYDEATKLMKKIDRFMQSIGLGKDAIKEVFPSSVTSCDGKGTPMPYLRIFSSETEHIPFVLVGFQRYGIHEYVEVIPDMFFEKDEIVSGNWKEQFDDLEELVAIIPQFSEEDTGQCGKGEDCCKKNGNYSDNYGCSCQEQADGG